MSETNDILTYCNRTIDVLQKLENNMIQLNVLKRDYESKIHYKRNRQAFLTAVIIPVFLVIYYVITSWEYHAGGQMTTFSTRIFAVIFASAMIGAFIFLTYNYLWNRDKLPFSKKVMMKKTLHDFQKKKDKVDENTRNLLSKDEIDRSIIPEEYLNIRSISLIMRYIKTGQADVIDEAIFMFELDMEKEKKRGNHYLTTEKPFLERVNDALDKKFEYELKLH